MEVEGFRFTELHVERGRQMKAILRQDIERGIPLEDAVQALAKYLGIDPEAVRLAVSIANHADRAGEQS